MSQQLGGPSFSISSRKEFAERNLDVSPHAFNYIAKENRDKTKGQAAKIALTASATFLELEEAEICNEHSGEQIIAMDTEPANDGTLTFGCNICVFQRKLAKPIFLAHQAR
jgi:hypothetical protein